MSDDLAPVLAAAQAWHAAGHGVAVATVPLRNVSGRMLATDVVPIICSNAEGRRLAADAVRRAGLNASPPPSLGRRVRNWLGLAAR